MPDFVQGVDPGSFAPLAAEVHIWRVPLDPPAGPAEAPLAALSAGERERAARFHFERDRRRFAVARAALRAILASYLGCAPEELAFGAAELGKPFLAAPGAQGLAFNVSHSHALALVAVTRGRALGVDVEHARPLADAGEIAARFFAPGEVAAWRALPGPERLAAFYRIWTRKEAYLKAEGTGLSRALDRFEVSLDEPARLLYALDDPRAATRWRLAAFEPEPGYAAAVAAEGPDWALVLRDYAPSASEIASNERS